MYAITTKGRFTEIHFSQRMQSSPLSCSCNKHYVAFAEIIHVILIQDGGEGVFYSAGYRR